MPSRDVARSFLDLDRNNTIGKMLKQMSDEVMEDTWNNDIQSRIGYLYDIYHDNRPNVNTGIDGYHDIDCTKKKVNIKFIVKSYKSISIDDPEYHIQFFPSEWNNQRCIPDWWKYETDNINYTDLGIDFPVGLYIDLPDDRGIYNRWLIVYREIANQFPKFGVVRCNHEFQWVTNTNKERFIRKMWGVRKTQNSYNSGIYTYNKYTVTENQGKVYLPWNYVSAELTYDQRLIVSMPTHTPLTWKISKVEDTVPKGVQLITLYQDEYNRDTDVIFKPDDPKNPFPNKYTMLADYNKYPDLPEYNDGIPIAPTGDYLVQSFGSDRIYTGRSKVITVNCFNKSDEDITSSYTSFVWNFYIDDDDVSDIVSVQSIGDNKIKITFNGDESYAFKVLKVKCVADNDTQSIEKTVDISILA